MANTWSSVSNREHTYWLDLQSPLWLTIESHDIMTLPYKILFYMLIISDKKYVSEVKCQVMIT